VTDEAFAYRHGTLHAEGVALERVAAEVGTPFYVYAEGALAANYDAFARGFAAAGRPALIAYGVKANDCLAVIAALARRGAGADVVSGGEIRRALAAGVAPERIVYSGVGKTRAEMELALATGIRQFNVESEGELLLLDRVARERGAKAPVALRVNPDVDAGTHDKISTGRKGDKFGIDLADALALYARATALPGIAVRGLAVHIGSQIVELAPFRRAFGRVTEAVGALRGQGLPVAALDFGGGLGVRYRDETPPAPADYAAMIAEVTKGLDLEIVVEPGRALVASAGALVTQVLYVKGSGSKRFLVVDAAMNDLIRPALYGAHHPVRTLRAQAPDAQLGPADIVGPVCESGDVLARDRSLPLMEAGQLLVIGLAGAYGRVMASCYNARDLIPEVFVRGEEWTIARRRPTFDESVALETVPDWLSGTGRRRGAA